MTSAFKAVLWDFGGVILSSPFDAFADYETEIGLPAGFIRGLNTKNPHTNAWAKFERSEVAPEEFCRLFEAEALTAGGELQGERIIACLSGDIRPAMVTALRNVASRYKTACLTNNVKGAKRSPEKQSAVAEIMTIFDEVIESSKVGVRKPESSFYEHACTALGIEPAETIFLDDLGINLKPARAMGMATIKVGDPEKALDELEALLGHSVRG